MSKQWKFDDDSSTKEIKEELVKVRGQMNTLLQEFRSKLPTHVRLTVFVEELPMNIGQLNPNYFVDMEIGL